jgi:Outer membrane protein beta-barrel domain
VKSIIKKTLMKKVCYLVFLVSILSVTTIRAQSFHLGVKVGTNLSEISGRSFKDGFQWGFTAGAFAELNIDKKWGIQPELLFNQTKTQTSNDFYTIIPNGFYSTDVNLNYLTIPVLLTFRPIPVLSFQLGPQFGILMSTSQTLTNPPSDVFKTGDFSIVGGAQVNIGFFKAGARYVSGLTNLNKQAPGVDSWKNESIQIYVGFRII